MILPCILGTIALLFFLNGLAIIVSPRYHEKYQSVLGMKVKAPQHVGAAKYYLINRILAGLGSVGAGAVVCIWIFQYLHSIP